MFQPLIECLSDRFGVTQFNLQVSGNADMMTIIIAPSLSAPAPRIDSNGYNPSGQTYRASLTTPVVVRAPLSEVDTRLAEILATYTGKLSTTLGHESVSTQLQAAVRQAGEVSKGSATSTKSSKPVSKPKEASPTPLAPHEQADPAATEFDVNVLNALGM